MLKKSSFIENASAKWNDHGSKNVKMYTMAQVKAADYINFNALIIKYTFNRPFCFKQSFEFILLIQTFRVRMQSEFFEVFK